jgi:hypothetical protein
MVWDWERSDHATEWNQRANGMKPKGTRRGNGATNGMDSKGTLRWRWIYLEDGKQFKFFFLQVCHFDFLARHSLPLHICFSRSSRVGGSVRNHLLALLTILGTL